MNIFNFLSVDSTWWSRG